MTAALPVQFGSPPLRRRAGVVVELDVADEDVGDSVSSDMGRF
jgi:hypothetical protein